MTVNPGQALTDAAEQHGGRVDRHGDHDRWWVTDPDSSVEDAAAHLGLVETRRLHQMRRPLPADGDPTPTRAFDPDTDADAWLAINNAAFAWHPDQGGWTRADLDARMAEPWFDADGFRIATDADGTMTGFCWTKVHTEEDPPAGEIYVIAVAPAHVGEGLGTGLTLAGLDWLWTHRHTPVGLLYVEAENTRALATYRRIGFEVAATDVAFEPPT